MSYHSMRIRHNLFYKWLYPIQLKTLFYINKNSVACSANNYRVFNATQEYFLKKYTKPFIFRFVFQHCLRSTLYFMFLSDERAYVQNVRLHFLYRQYTNLLYFDLYFNTAYAAYYILCFSLTKGLRSKR